MSEILYSKSFEIDAEKPTFGIYESLYGLKRDLILFDKIVFPNLDKFCRHLIIKEGRKFPFETQLAVNELQSLKSKGLIRDYKLEENYPLLKPLLQSMSPQDRLTTEMIIGIAGEHAKGIQDLVNNKLSYMNEFKVESEYDRVYWGINSSIEKFETILVTKLISFIETSDIIDFFPIKYGRTVKQDSTEVSTPLPSTENKADINNAYCFVLNELPFPSNSTPWEAILDYRSEPDNQLRLSRMRTWIRKTLKEEYSEKELKEEYEHLYLEFENSMKYHKIKNQRSGLKVFLTILPELAEDLVKLRFGKIATGIYNSIFSATLEQVQLYETETNSPGKEIAYNFFAKERF